MDDTKFIIIFTVCFVIVGVIAIGGGYMILQSDILKPGPATATVTPVPSQGPQGPTATPAPTAPIIIPATPTPEPTPVPSQYGINVNYLGDTSSRTYTVSYTLKGNSPSINMDQVLISVWKDGLIYHNYTYGEAAMSGAGWSGADGDNMLENGETYIFKVNGYTLNIPPDTESRVSFIVSGELVRTTTLPYLINPVVTGQPPDPEATINPYG